jgi:hypothetical protein
MAFLRKKEKNTIYDNDIKIWRIAHGIQSKSYHLLKKIIIGVSVLSF